ncbi:Nicastrin [Ananas comosus]|uniref:Nicastrin n=1 Tax=Ananas comosus TaxID=4615 RepID=A0A199VEX0_ANACO|nr:Nicastrin [Ananas comosus]
MAPRGLLGALSLSLLLGLLHFSIPGAIGTLESVPDLEKAMYLNMESFPCVRLLNLSGEIGCANPGNEKIIAPIVRFGNNHDQLDRSSAVFLPLELMQRFRVISNFPKKLLAFWLSPVVSRIIHLGSRLLKSFHKLILHHIRTTGSGIMWNRYNFPVFLLSAQSTLILQEIANNDAENNNKYPAHVAEFDLVMQTTKVGTHDSESCLKEQSCLPLGGYSVWSSLPPINASLMKPLKPVVMAIASLDSASFFRDRSLGADSPISGLIALLTAVDALSNVEGLDKLKKQLVFAVFTGEAWGYLGSRKFLQELEMGTDSVNGLNNTLVEQVLEVGSVGKGLVQGGTTFYAHAGGKSSLTKEILSALQSASISLGSDNVKVKTADTSNPGIPPSSLMTFLRKSSSTSGVVLEDFDSSFINRFYHSHLDDPSNINSSSIAAAAALVAPGDLPLNLMALNSIKVNVSLVDELIGCLLTCEPGLSCGIVRKYISPSNICPCHYVGVFLDSPPDTQFPQYADDTSRFVWNFLADRTSIKRDTSSSCAGECSNVGEICIGVEIEGKGRCVKSTTRYVPAYSTRLKFEDNWWHVLPPNSSDPMGAVDPIWTESFWNTIGLRVYRVQSATYDRIILVGGMSITITSYIAVIAVRAYLAKAVKRD